MEEDDDYIFHSVEYTIVSHLEFNDENRYCQEIIGEIRMRNENDDNNVKTITIGSLKGYKVLADLASKRGYSILDIIDLKAETNDVAEYFYDNSDWNEEIEETLGDDLAGLDMLILSRIIIYSEYRGQGLGGKVIKDFYNNFIQGCGLFGLKCYPLQCELKDIKARAPKKERDSLKELEPEHIKAFKSLSKYYKSLGFENVKGLPKEILIINPVSIGAKFRKIELT